MKIYSPSIGKAFAFITRNFSSPWDFIEIKLVVSLVYRRTVTSKNRSWMALARNYGENKIRSIYKHCDFYRSTPWIPLTLKLQARVQQALEKSKYFRSTHFLVLPSHSTHEGEQRVIDVFRWSERSWNKIKSTSFSATRNSKENSSTENWSFEERRK